MAKRVTMTDIAKEAGVSLATVSYIINKRSDQTIAPETIRKVKEAIDKLGYVPNFSARALASSRSMLLGLVIPQTEKEEKMMFSNTFYGEFLSSFEFEARKRGYNILISGKDIDTSYVKIAKQRCLDGVVAVGLQHSSELDELVNSGIPLVLVDSYIDTDKAGCINLSDREGGRLATSYLRTKGHERIALVTGYTNEKGVNSERFNGYRDAMESKYDPELVYSGTVSYSFGLRIGEEIAEKRNGISAVFATADILAIGVINGLKKKGARVPEDVSVVGFDDGMLSMLSDPGLTTIHQDVDKKAVLAAEMIISRVEKKDGFNESIVLPVSITERSSVTKAK